MTGDDTPTVKRCAKCWRHLPTDHFGHDGRTKDRLTYRCNDCRAFCGHTPTADLTTNQPD